MSISCAMWLNISIILHDQHVSFNLVFDGGPVEHVSSRHALRVVQIQRFDLVSGEGVVPHVQVCELAGEALHRLEVAQVFVGVLAEKSGALGLDAVTRFIQLKRAAASVHPEGRESSARGPGEAQVGPEGGERRQVEKRSVATEVEGHAAVFLSPHVELVEVGRPVGEENDLTLALELRRDAHAERERCKAQWLLRGEFNIAEISLVREQEHFTTETHFRSCWCQREQTEE